jgi:hypothetical protein
MGTKQRARMRDNVACATESVPAETYGPLLAELMAVAKGRPDNTQARPRCPSPLLIALWSVLCRRYDRD